MDPGHSKGGNNHQRNRPGAKTRKRVIGPSDESKQDAANRLLCLPPLKSVRNCCTYNFDVIHSKLNKTKINNIRWLDNRKEGTVPTYIPHKHLLNKIDEKLVLPEPLSGFSRLQKSFLRESQQSLSVGEPLSVKSTIRSTIIEPAAPELRLGHSKLKNVVDQKKCIQMMRQKTDGSLIYLKYAVPKSSELYSPYALKIVSYSEAHGDVFLTMTAKGVMQHVGNEMIFTPLDKWEEEYDIYCRLMQIKTFYCFRMWKNFYVWRKNIIYCKFLSAQNFLKDNLFVTNDILRDALLNIQLMCYKLWDTSFTNVQTIEDYLLFYFIEDQMEKMEILVENIKEFRVLTKEIVGNACHRALLAKGFVLDERKTFAKERKKALKSATKFSYIEQASKKKFCKRLTCFIMLVDYMMINMLHRLLTNSLNELNATLKSHIKYLPSNAVIASIDLQENLEIPRSSEDPKQPFINANVRITKDEINLDPSLKIVKDIFNQIFGLWKQHTNDIKSFIADSFYSEFTTPIINGKVEDRICGWGPTLSFYLSVDEHLEESHKQFFNYFETNYNAAHLYLERYKFILDFFAEDCSVLDDDIQNEIDLEKFRKMCIKYHNEIKIIQDVKALKYMGILCLDFNGFKEEALPAPSKLLELVNNVLPWLGKTRVDELINESSEAENYLLKDPIQTVEYVRYLEYLDQVNEKVDNMETKLDYCKDLYDIMDEFRIVFAPEEMAKYLSLSVTMSNLRNLVDKTIESIPKIMKKFTAQKNKETDELNIEISNIKNECMAPWLYDIESNNVEVIEFLNELNERLLECQNRANEFKNYEKQFRMELTRFDALDEAINDVKLRMLLWESLESWNKTLAEWYTCDFSTLNVEEVNMYIAKTIKNINQLEKGLPSNLIVPKLRYEVQLIKDKIPIISYLRNPSLRQRHWLKIEQLLNFKLKPDEIMTLEQFESLNVFNYPEELMDISGQASSEAGLEALLKKVEESWESLEFIVLPHKDLKDVFILGTLEDVQATLDESNINITTIASSKHVGPIKSRVDDWIKQLDLFSKTLDEWMKCQQSWIYLEVIFSAPDIQRQLPNESKMFLIVDKSWKNIMRRTAKMPLAMEAALYPGLLETFQKNNVLLEQIMKCLESYLETKRVAFPRFYFLSNDELLDILAQTRNPHAVQPHLRKCFDAIAKLEFGVKIPDENEENTPIEVILTTDIIAMISPEGERVQLGKGLKARGNVEDWLGKVEESMFLSLRRLMKISIQDYMNRPRTDWVVRHANQIILAVSQMMWAKDVHTILDNPNKNVQKGLEAFQKKCVNDLNDLAALIRQNLSSVTRKILIALITIDVHARDTIHSMVESKVRDSSSFDWLKVLRYYWLDTIDDCVARMSSAQYVYGYEYLGASGVLVITPLTDRCYLCLMGALQLDLGGAPAGPAGTGKTETTKDLAKALAIQCVVFNCSEGLDYKMMGRFFSGLAQSGAWCCFDEFNRIDIEVLSVIAQQLITIRNAKAAKLPRFMFEGREIKMVQKCAAFITMNPGYAGRTELPDNLKALFRPISMMVPDYALIAEVILYSEGFESSRILSQKMVQMYKLCSEQLSQQDHYDFGMRAVKSVLVMAGSLKRANPERNEDVVLICALRDSNLPKFLSDDAILFKGILSDLFPGTELPVQDYGLFQETIEAVMLKQNLQQETAMIAKVIQLYETMIVRWGVMLVGPTGGGKSTILNTLGLALTKMYDDQIEGPYYRPVQTYTMNPKAVTAGELYGEVNPFTMEWRDGLMGIMMRTAVQSTNEDHQWIICDGPVDAVWIENLNTVLDDNKMLCLANSERIKLTPYVHMVFEVQDLSQASPATVSRCGMVYIDSEELKWLPYVKSWLQNVKPTLLNEEWKEYVLSLFETYIEKGFIFIKKNCDYSIHQVEVSKGAMACTLFESFISMPGAMEKIGEKSKVRNFLCQTFIFCYVWALGGNLLDESKEKFESYVQDQFDDNPDARLPAGNELGSVYMEIQSHRLEPWNRIVPNFKYDKDVPFFETLVPTIDTIRFGFVAERLLYKSYPVLLTGDTGVGKSVIAKDVLNRLNDSSEFVSTTINFSAQTSSARTQEIIELKLEKKKKTLLGAPHGKRVIIFVDDVNMPKLETYGAQPPIELLRQFLDYGGLYDREKLFWKQIWDVILMAACAPPGGGRNPLTPRFVRHFGILQIPSPNEFFLKAIFKSILKGFLFDFSNEVRDLGDSMVNAAVEIYDRIATDLLPTPAKSHYVFNLRDLSKCIQGITQANAGTMREESAMLRLFYHECLRVFHDRLINVEDKSYFYFLMKDVCSRNFGTTVLMLPDVPILTDPPILLFGDFMQTSASKEDRFYEEIRNTDKCKSVLQDYLDDFNLMTSKEMNLIFFMAAIEHCVRIARILRAERGNALLVGVGGMGKQSLTKLSSHLNGYKCYQIELTRNYDHSSFFEDLRKLYFSAGVENNNITFLFTDTQIKQEEFLEDINNMLNSGEVPNLFESDELEKVIIGTREAAKEAGIVEANRDAIFEFFIKRVRSKLHLVICMSPVGDAFRRRCRMFPSLVNCCTIDWFEKWPQEALLSVAKNSLKDIGDEELCENLSIVCVAVHESVESMTERFYNEMRRHYYTTPSSYLELIKLYKMMLEKRKTKLISLRDRIQNGLKKIYETNSVIDSMKETLIALEPELAKKSIVVAELMKNLAKEQKSADKVRVIVKADEEVAKIKADETQLLADDAQRDLDTALPALEAATKALEALNKNDINELKVFQKPPKLVQFVMESICLLLGSKIDWSSAKQVLADTNFLKKLQDYDKDHISENVLKKLKAYIDHPDFIPDKVATVSKVCKSMCMWVRAIDMYAKVYKIVEPKRKRLQDAEKELNQVMGLLREKQRQLADVEAMIASLEAKFNQTMAEKEALEANIELTSNRLNRAGRLNIALGDEQIRWEEGVKSLSEAVLDSVGDVLKAAASVAYLGAFTNNYREELVQYWEQKCQELSIPSAKSFSLSNVLADPYTIRMWNTCGLPRDLVSTENGILVTEAGRWPLMIDPQEQANRWIRQMEIPNGLKIIKLTDSNFMRILENAIRLGVPVLLEEVGETLDPTLTPVFLKQTFVQAGRKLIHLGDSDVDYDDNFRLYVTTKLANPHYLPEICIQVTVVNFTVTPSGLEDQLLADVVRIERPELEIQRTELVVRINNDKSQLKNIEDKILYLLYNSQGNILDDEVLIETLNESKETSAIIAARLIEAEATEEKISIAREKYRSVATRGSVLYFVVAQLAEIDPMYQYSLKYFKQIFNIVIENSEKSSDLEEHLNNLYNNITLAIYTNVSRGLFERHKLVFSFMLCVAILKEKDLVSDSQWDFLLRGPVGSKIESSKKPDSLLLTDAMWNSVNYLAQTYEHFKLLSVSEEVLNIINIKFGDFSLEIKIDPTKRAVSNIPWNNILDDFEKLLLIKTLKEEKLVFAITEFVKLKLGQVFIESPQVSLNVLYQDTSNIVPLVFVLSTGSDPFGAFQRFASEMGFGDRVKSISLGQGQGPVAEKLIRSSLDTGDWVFLQNCHLATSWMLAMERTVLEIAEEGDKIHKDFRLYLSSMPSKSFPVAVLQNSVKVTNEPPKGLRANIKRALTDMLEGFFEDHPLEQDWRSMLFGICMFHAIIQERKKFGPLGWNIIYEFNDSDREFAFNTLKMYCEEGRIPWDALEYLTGEITYGGRVTDYWDLRCLKTILKIFFSPQILQQHYVYSSSGVYYCPRYDKLTDYRIFADQLPIIEEPEIFGMHENANIAYQTKETQTIINTIMESQPRASSGAEGKSSDDIVYELAEMVISSIMPKIQTEEVNLNMFKKDEKGRLPSLTTVLIQEIDRYNILLKLIHNSMENLKKAIKGLIVMSDALEEVFKAFINNKIPQMWSKKAYNSLKSLGSWVHDLVLRLDFISIWVRYGHPTSYWLSGFYFPQGFLTGTLQTHARKYNLPIDTLKFDFVIKSVIIDQEAVMKLHLEQEKEVYEAYSPLESPNDGIIIHGLFIDAGRWSKNRLVDAKPGQINPPLPAVCFIPTTEMPEDDKRYVAPLYKTSVRAGVLSTTGHSTNFILSILLPSDKDQSYWILKGTALLTQLTD